MTCDDKIPDIRVKEPDPEPIRGRGFAHLETEHVVLGIEGDEEHAPGELHIGDRRPDENTLFVSFEFDTLGARHDHSASSLGFELDVDEAERLAAYLQSWAHYKRTGEWIDPEADDV